MKFHYVITYTGKEEQEPLFWNNLFYGSILTATIYTSKRSKLPEDGAWQTVWRAIIRTVDFHVKEVTENE